MRTINRSDIVLMEQRTKEHEAIQNIKSAALILFVILLASFVMHLGG